MKTHTILASIAVLVSTAHATPPQPEWTKQVSVIGFASDYASCAALRAQGKAECATTFPGLEKCIDESTRYADGCVSRIDKGLSVNYNFRYPVRHQNLRAAEAAPAVPSARVQAEVKTYPECSKTLLQSNEACQVFKEWSADPNAPVRFKCIEAATSIGDKCFASVLANGTKPFTWNFSFPAGAAPSASTTAPATASSSATTATATMTSVAAASSTATATATAAAGTASVKGTAKTLSECAQLQNQGNKACGVFPEYSTDSAAPVRYLCLNVNVEIGNKCYAAVKPDGSVAYEWAFAFPAPKSDAVATSAAATSTSTAAASTTSSAPAPATPTQKSRFSAPDDDDSSLLDPAIARAFLAGPSRAARFRSARYREAETQVPPRTFRIESIGYAYNRAACRAYFVKGREGCEAVKEWYEDPSYPVRSQCVDANVRYFDLCNSAFDQGEGSYYYNFWFTVRV
ncbi:hypothetical protein HDU96_010893 [Phlyctochytrium bullatum]|nr:hypothetical protein HDU96_010893 [Phlyctochytrium bullatum]